MSGAYYNNPPDYRYDSRDPRDGRDPRDRERPPRAWDSRDRARGRGGGGGPSDFENYGRLREDDYTPNGTRRVRSPGPPPRRRPARSRSPPNIDRYTPGSGGGGPGGPGPGSGSGGPPGRYNSGDVYIPGSSAQGMPGGGGSGGGPHPMGRPDPIDRYVPGGNLPAGGPSPSNNMLAPILLDPHNFDHIVPFTYFSDWYHGTPASAPSKAKYGEDMTMKEKYEMYKEALPGRVAKIFVRTHKDAEWFKEKYLSNDGENWKINMKQWRKNQWHVWSKELGSGKWDNWTADAKEGTKFNQIINNHSTEKSEAAATEEKEDKEENEDEEAEDGAVDETPAAGSGNNTLHDDTLDRPALLIKTVSPTVRRGKLQELASTVEGFQYLSLGDPNPLKKFHRIGWIMVDPAVATEASLESSAALLNEERIHDEEKGDFVVHVGVHNPPKILTRKLLHDVMSLPKEIISEVDRIREVVLKFERKLNDDEHDVLMEDSGEDISYHGWDLIIGKVDELMAKRLAEKAQDEPEEEPEDGEAEDDKPSDDEVERAKRTIDIAVEYLRRVFSFCYYCFTEADSIHELVRRCPGGHLRRPLPPPPPSGDVTEKPLHPASEKWAKNLRDKISLFLNPESADLKKLGGQDVESAVYEEVTKYMKQEDEGKFRCRVKDCTKLFKSEVFVRKHVEKRHTEFVEGLEQEATLINRYVLDPFRIVPPKDGGHQPNGGGGPGGPMGGGFPMRQNNNFDPSRGFMGPYGMYAPFPEGYPGGGGGMHNPNNVDRYTPGGGRGRPDLMAGNIGPMRRRPMGGAIHMMRGNPYARPPMMSSRERMEREREREGRFQAAMAGATSVAQTITNQNATAGAKDADTAGRSLKSYMDLDAANSGTSKVDELDY